MIQKNMRSPSVSYIGKEYNKKNISYIIPYYQKKLNDFLVQAQKILWPIL